MVKKHYFPPMKKGSLTDLGRQTLEECFKNHPKAHVRHRCHALLLLDRGERVKTVATLYETRTRTIYTWIKRWELMGIAGLFIFPGRGLKPTLDILNEVIIEHVKEVARKKARSLTGMCKELSELLGLTVTRHKLRRFLKKLGYRWKRFRKSLKSKQDPEVYEKKLTELQQLIDLHKNNFIDLVFADATGFNLQGYIPYGWQPANEYIHITPSKKGSLQIFGFMGLDNSLEAYSCKGSLNSAAVIAFMDDFVKRITQPTVAVIDNASIHHSGEFHLKIEEWKEQGLHIFFLPPYSPHLNPIEILWRKMKYEWIEYENIATQEELEAQVMHILNNFGQEFTIQFNERILAKEKVSIIYA